MYNSKIIIWFLHCNMFWPLFLAIIRQYLYSPSQLSLLSPLHWPMFTTGGRSYCCLQCRSLVIDLNKRQSYPCRISFSTLLFCRCNIHCLGITLTLSTDCLKPFSDFSTMPFSVRWHFPAFVHA
jgi:hypothetical protein